MKTTKIKQGSSVIRVSTKDQGLVQHGSLEAQQQRINRWAEARKLTSGFIYEITKFIAEEQSAFREKNEKRVQMMELMKDMGGGKVKFIIFESVSRLFRDVEYATRFYRLAEKNEIEIWEIESGINYNNPGNPYSYMMFIQKAAASEAESMITSNRVKCKHREAMVMHGKDPSPRPSFLGLDLHPTKVGFYIINQQELKIVLDIIQAFVRLKSYADTLNYCSQKNYRTKRYVTKEKVDRDGNIIQSKMKGGEPFEHASLVALLTNPRYAGFSSFIDTNNQFPQLQDDGQRVTWSYAHGRVIDQKLLDQVKETSMVAGFNKSIRKSPTKDLSLLGQLIQDSQGQIFHCQSAKNHQYRYYFNPVNDFRIPMDELDKNFIKLLDSYKEDPSTLNKILNDYMGRLKVEVAQYGNQIVEVCSMQEKKTQELDQLNLAKREKLMGGASDQVILFFDEEIKKVETEIGELSQKKNELAAKKDEAVASCNEDYIKANFAKIVDAIKSTKGSDQKLLIKSLVKRVVIEADSVAKIVFDSKFLLSPRRAEPGGNTVAESGKWWGQQDLNL